LSNAITDQSSIQVLVNGQDDSPRILVCLTGDTGQQSMYQAFS